MLSKNFFYNFVLNNNVSPFYFRKTNKWIYWRHGVDVSDDVTNTKAIRRVNDKMFKCFDNSMSTIES